MQTTFFGLTEAAEGQKTVPLFFLSIGFQFFLRLESEFLRKMAKNCHFSVHVHLLSGVKSYPPLNSIAPNQNLWSAASSSEPGLLDIDIDSRDLA